MKQIWMAVLLTSSLSFATISFAAGDTPATPSESEADTKNKKADKPECKKGFVLKTIKKDGKLKKDCVKAEAGILPDEEFYAQGRELAKSGKYEDAIQLLSLIKKQEDPRVLNYLGYSNRKAGRLEVGITYYRKALAIDPNFVLAREYLGEGYVAAGRIDLAKVELAEIARRCGKNCEEFKDLQKVINTAMN